MSRFGLTGGVLKIIDKIDVNNSSTGTFFSHVRNEEYLWCCIKTNLEVKYCSKCSHVFCLIKWNISSVFSQTQFSFLGNTSYKFKRKGLPANNYRLRKTLLSYRAVQETHTTSKKNWTSASPNQSPATKSAPKAPGLYTEDRVEGFNAVQLLCRVTQLSSLQTIDVTLIGTRTILHTIFSKMQCLNNCWNIKRSQISNVFTNIEYFSVCFTVLPVSGIHSPYFTYIGLIIICMQYILRKKRCFNLKIQFGSVQCV